MCRKIPHYLVRRVISVTASLLLLMFSLVTSRLVAAEIQLATSGRSDYKIVVPVDATPVQNSASKELQSYFKQVTNVELPIVSEKEISNVDDVTNQKLFIIGPSALSQKVLGDVDETAIAYDGVILKSTGNSIVLSGHPIRGPLYSVYEFLETKLGCRWWTSTESTIPSVAELVIDNDLDVYYAPKLEYRESYYRDIFNGPFAVKMKCNGNGENISAELGGRRRFQYFVHSSFPLIPPQKYFLSHPDWFSEIDGIRKVGFPGWAGPSNEYKDFQQKLKPEQISESGTQLCFSNDEMLAEMTKNAREALRKNPGASFLSISQNDWHGFCTCEKCRAADEEDGSHAGSLLRGVNKIAEALEDEFPNLYIETLAYQYTRKPPKVTKPRKNVVIRLCSIECSFSQPLASDMNSSFRDDLVGWSKIADKLFVWDYATDFAFYLLPFPNYRVLAPNIRFYIDHNVVGFFEQGDYQCETGDFVQLRNWVVSKLLWDPSQDPRKLAETFISGYYAPELVPIYMKYFDVLSDAVEKDDYYLGIYKTTTNGWLDVESLNEATRLQKKALETAERLERENPDAYKGLVAKVRREQIPLDIVWLQEYRRVRLESRIKGFEFLGPDDPLKAAQDLCAKFKEFGLTKKREGESFESFKAYQEGLIDSFANYADESKLPVPDICKNIPKNSWLMLQEYDLSTHKIGELTFLVDDSNASNGKSVRMPGSHYEWATAWHVSSFINLLVPSQEQKDGETPIFHIYAFVRCDAQTNDGPAMTAGIYDEGAKKGLTHVSIPVADISGSEYKMIDLGTTALPNTSYIWFAPPKRANEVDNVFIDSVIIIRER